MTPDFFTPQAFNLITMTGVINKQPYKPGFITSLGIFEEEGVATQSVFVEEYQGVLKILPTEPRNGPRTASTRERRIVRSFNVPHIPASDYIRADEISGVRQFGSEDQLQTLEFVRDQRLTKMANNLDVTLEYHAVGAIKGIVYDADGSSVLYNMFTEFNVSQQAVINMDLENASQIPGATGAPGGAIRKQAAKITRTISKALGAAEPSGIVVLCGDNFFDDLVGANETRRTYEFQEGQQLRTGYAYSTFRYGDITWVNYRSDGIGPSNAFIHTDWAFAFPVGVPGLFIRRFAPANYFETVNTIGLPRYAKAVADDWNKFIEVEAQANPLTLCTRPSALVALYKTMGKVIGDIP